METAEPVEQNGMRFNGEKTTDSNKSSSTAPSQKYGHTTTTDGEET